LHARVGVALVEITLHARMLSRRKKKKQR